MGESMKISDNGVQIPQSTVVSKTSVGDGSAVQNPLGSKNTPEATSAPAVNLDIGLTAKLAEVQSDSKTSKATDEALIEKLRSKIASGEYQIDYRKISQAMIKDVVASIGQKQGRA
jgi:flagellar biosynthesis anti-sigma factor FlgM